MPEHILNGITEKSFVYTTTTEFINLHDLQNFIHTDKEIIRLNEELLKHFQAFENHTADEESYIRRCRQAVWKYFDTVLLTEALKQEKDFYQSGIQHIFGIVSGQYKLCLLYTSWLYVFRSIDDCLELFFLIFFLIHDTLLP